MRLGTATRRDSLDLAIAELVLGRTERGHAIAAALAESKQPADSLVLSVLGEAEFGLGHFERAGRLFAEVAKMVDGRERGVFSARAGVALDRADRPSEAAQYFRRAAVLLPEASGWLAVREAAGTDEAIRALSLLRRAPPEAVSLAADIRGAVHLAAGDTIRALAAYATASNWIVAAELAFSVGDTASGRLHVFRALLSDDTTSARAALNLVRDALPPPSGYDAYVVASAHRRLGELDKAVGLLDSLVAAGDTSAATLRRLGDLCAALGKRRDALEAYERAVEVRDGDGAGEEAAQAEYRRGRLLTQSGQTREGYEALEAFAWARSWHASAPYALYLVADWHRRARRTAVADSLLAQLADQWPGSAYASRARMTLATSALARRDTTAALEWYQAEAHSTTAERHAARYFRADLLARTGDTVSATQEWRQLAAQDSLGYYGLLARRAVGLGEPRLAPAESGAPSVDVSRTLERLDLLRLSYLDAEARALLRYQTSRDNLGAEEALSLAEGLIERGWVQEGVSLGWRVARDRTLNDARVLRVIFPWPLRALIEQEAAEQGVDPYLLAGLIRQESTFRPKVISRAGAHGLTQLMPSTASEVARRNGIPWDRRYLTSAEVNLHVGTSHFAALLRQYDGNVILALAAYNAGGRPVARWRRFPEAGDPIRFVERIPYVETRNYLRAVLRNQSLYRALYPSRNPRGVVP
jgi:soluble lytic murein transglycosylase